MAHALWTGTINFGLVTIPVKLYTAIRENELHFNMLHKKDMGRINFARTCAECNKKLDWDEIGKGFEYEKGRYVLLTDEDFAQANVEATQSIDIQQFVNLAEINPMYFEKPYYLEPEKKGRHAYALLREALVKSGKVGIARTVIRTREHLAAVKPQGDALVLEIMHFADELIDAGDFDFPEQNEKVPPAEMKAALMLVDTMAAPFDPTSYRDKYRDDLMNMIEARARGKQLKKPAKKAPAKAEVINLMDVLQESLKRSHARRGANGEPRKAVARTR